MEATVPQELEPFYRNTEGTPGLQKDRESSWTKGYTRPRRMLVKCECKVGGKQMPVSPWHSVLLEKGTNVVFISQTLEKQWRDLTDDEEDRRIDAECYEEYKSYLLADASRWVRKNPATTDEAGLILSGVFAEITDEIEREYGLPLHQIVVEEDLGSDRGTVSPRTAILRAISTTGWSPQKVRTERFVRTDADGTRYVRDPERVSVKPLSSFEIIRDNVEPEEWPEEVRKLELASQSNAPFQDAITDLTSAITAAVSGGKKGGKQ